MRSHVRLALVAFAAVALLAVPTTAHAAVFRTGDTVVVGPNERIDDDVYLFGNSVQVLGVVTGDVVAAGRIVEVGGNVADDVMAAGSTVRVGADVGGSTRVAGTDVTIDNRVAGDVLAAGTFVTVPANTSIERDAYLAGSTVTLAGEVARNVGVSGSRAILSGVIGGDAKVEADQFRALEGSEIAGDLTYTAQDAELDGTVNGATTDVPAPTSEPSPESDGSGAWGTLFFFAFLYWIRALVGYVIFGLIVVLVFRRFSADSASALQAKAWPALGWGALVVFGFPLVFTPAFVVGLMIGGWWIAVLALFAWFTLLAIGLVVGALCIGRLIVSRRERKPHDVWPMLLGLGLLWIVWIVPFLGTLIIVGAMIFGVGGVVLAIADRRSGRSNDAGDMDPTLPKDAPPQPAPESGTDRVPVQD